MAPAVDSKHSGLKRLAGRSRQDPLDLSSGKLHHGHLLGHIGR